MKRFLLFAGETHYPGGGALDFEGAFASMEEAGAALRALPQVYGDDSYLYKRGWAHIAELTDEGMQVVRAAEFADAIADLQSA